MKPLGLIFFSCFLCINLLYSASAWSASVEDFAKLPQSSYYQLSPDGKSVAYEMVYNGKPALITKALASDSKIKPGALPLNGAHLQWFRWVNNERLIVAIRMSADAHTTFGTTYRIKVPRHSFISIFSIDRSGLKPVYFDMDTNKYGYRNSYPRLISMLKHDPEHVLLGLDPLEENFFKYKAHKVNVYTGKKTLVESNFGGYHGFIADNQGRLRLAYRYKGTDVSLYSRPTEKDNFKLLQRKNFMDKERLLPVRFDYSRDNVLIFTSGDLEDDDYDQDDEDLFEMDITTGEWLGEHKDKVRIKTKEIVEKSFKGKRVDLRSWTNDITLDKAIYEVYADNSPSQYFVFSIKEKRIDYIGSEYPQLQNTSLSKMQELEYKARDGMSIPAYLSLPNSAEKKSKPNLPTIIFPHGGPWSRDYWGFDSYVQFFTSKGYAVLQPQFRGSSGFGYEHLRAGDKQWGLKIQDDISDGVKWMVENGIANPKKICIVGASFGGYAAGMGLASTPDLYTCGISINGVLDMKFFNVNTLRNNRFNRELTNDEWGIKKVSPLHLAKNIDDPMLIIYGADDSVVDPKHSKKMHKMLKRKKKVSELVELPKGEHWRTIEANEIKIFKVMDVFLSEHLD